MASTATKVKLYAWVTATISATLGCHQHERKKHVGREKLQPQRYQGLFADLHQRVKQHQQGKMDAVCVSTSPGPLWKGRAEETRFHTTWNEAKHSEITQSLSFKIFSTDVTTFWYGPLWFYSKFAVKAEKTKMFNILLDLAKAEMLLLQSLFLDFICHCILLHVYVKWLRSRSSHTSSLFILYLLPLTKAGRALPPAHNKEINQKRESAE